MMPQKPLRLILCVCIVILWLGVPVFAAEQWDLPDTLTGSDFTNRFQVGLGFEYRNQYSGSLAKDLYGIKGPTLHGFLKKNVFFIYGSIEGSWTWGDRSLSFILPEMAGGVILDHWRIRGGILHSRLGTPWQDEWQPKSEWAFRYEENKTLLNIYFTSSLPGLEAIYHPNDSLGLGMGIYYRDFSVSDDPLFPQLTLDFFWRPIKMLSLQTSLSSWQSGRRASSDNPFLDRRTYHGILSASLGPLTTEHFLNFYFYQEQYARFDASHALGWKQNFFNEHLRARVSIGLSAGNAYTNTQLAGFADAHISLHFKYMQIFIEDHLSQSLYNFLVLGHQFILGAEFYFTWR